MTTEINDGGPAFPHPALADENFKPRPGDGGMTMRQWYAGQALPALVAYACANAHALSAVGIDQEKWAANTAFMMADHMIAKDMEGR